MCFALILCLDPGNLIALLFGFFCISTWRVCCCSALFCTFFRLGSSIPDIVQCPFLIYQPPPLQKDLLRWKFVCSKNVALASCHPDLDSTSLAFFPHLVATFMTMRVQSEKPSRDRKQWVFMSQCSKDSTVQIAWALFRLSVFTVRCSSTHGIRICIKRKKIDYGKFFDFCAEKCVYN